MKHRKQICSPSCLLMNSMGIFKYLRQSKDPSVLKELNQYFKYSIKLAEAREHVQFLESCIREGTFPRHFSAILRRHHIKPTNVTLKRHTLNEIDTIKSAIEQLKRNQTDTSQALNRLTDDERIRLEDYLQTTLSKQMKRQMDKLTTSVAPQMPPATFPENPERYVHNLSSAVLSDKLVEVLSLGHKFCVPKRKIRQLDLEVEFENLFCQLQDLSPTSQLNSDHFKSSLVDSCFHYFKTKSPVATLLRSEHFEALRELRGDSTILITKPDKGAGVVLLDRADYLCKMDGILGDRTKFLLTNNEKDKTTAIERGIAKKLRILKQQGIISSQLFERIRPTGTVIPRLYGLPKIHKDGVPLRPILDMTNSPYHALAQWLAELLGPVQQRLSSHSLKDTFHFVETIKNLNVTGKRMLSLDVCSLFTNVPLVETVDLMIGFIAQHNIQLGIPSC